MLIVKKALQKILALIFAQIICSSYKYGNLSGMKITPSVHSYQPVCSTKRCITIRKIWIITLAKNSLASIFAKLILHFRATIPSWFHSFIWIANLALRKRTDAFVPWITNIEMCTSKSCSKFNYIIFSLSKVLFKRGKIS